TCGIILAGLCIWSLIRKIPYSYLVNIRVDIPYFALPAAVLCFPSSWIAMSIHNNRKKYQFLHLLIVLLLVSISLLVTGPSLGTMSKIDYSDMTVMVSSLDVQHLNFSLQTAIENYDTIPDSSWGWNKMQTQLGCCGITSYKDWLKMKLSVPNSCCRNNICNTTNIYSRGCLESLSRDLTWHKNILSSQCYITALLQVSFFL
ncbi:hypothetical protein NQ318_012582, partial [Aromia moschata]